MRLICPGLTFIGLGETCILDSLDSRDHQQNVFQLGPPRLCELLWSLAVSPDTSEILRQGAFRIAGVTRHSSLWITFRATCCIRKSNVKDCSKQNSSMIDSWSFVDQTCSFQATCIGPISWLKHAHTWSIERSERTQHLDIFGGFWRTIDFELCHAQKITVLPRLKHNCAIPLQVFCCILQPIRTGHHLRSSFAARKLLRTEGILKISH